MASPPTATPPPTPSPHPPHTQSTWTAVDRLFESHFLPPSDPLLTHVLTSSHSASLPPHSVTPLQGQLLHLLALTSRASTVLEVGTLAAYSTIHLARALPPQGHLVTLESNPTHAALARAHLHLAALPCRVELREGPAAESMRQLQAEGAVFDLVFIDADKVNNALYYELALEGLTREGSVIVVDNVVRGGTVVDEALARSDASVRGVREWLARVKGDERVVGTAIQTVAGDDKGYDGFALMRVTGKGRGREEE